jgi:hypothetical protein
MAEKVNQGLPVEALSLSPERKPFDQIRKFSREEQQVFAARQTEISRSSEQQKAAQYDGKSVVHVGLRVGVFPETYVFLSM